MPNIRFLGHFLVVYFGGSSCSSSCCDRGKTKSTPSPSISLDLGLDFDNKDGQTLIWIKCD